MLSQAEQNKLLEILSGNRADLKVAARFYASNISPEIQRFILAEVDRSTHPADLLAGLTVVFGHIISSLLDMIDEGNMIKPDARPAMTDAIVRIFRNGVNAK